MDHRPEVGLILACYNEAEHFRKSVREIIAVLDSSRRSYEIIFVDDCSRDDTRLLIDQAIAAYPGRRLGRIFHQRNTGRGGTVSDGFRAATADIVGYIDIDLEVHARYIPACVQAIEEGADIAVAGRVYKFYLRSIDRYAMSQGYRFLASRLLAIPPMDTESGYKFFRRERLLPLLSEIEDQGWFWDTEVMVRAHHKGYRIAEVPALFVRRFDKGSTVRSVRDTLTYLRRLLRFRRVL